MCPIASPKHPNPTEKIIQVNFLDLQLYSIIDLKKQTNKKITKALLELLNFLFLARGLFSKSIHYLGRFPQNKKKAKKTKKNKTHQPASNSLDMTDQRSTGSTPTNVASANSTVT